AISLSLLRKFETEGQSDLGESFAPDIAFSSDEPGHDLRLDARVLADPVMGLPALSDGITQLFTHRLRRPAALAHAAVPVRANRQSSPLYQYWGICPRWHRPTI